mgnify:FL=1
MLGPKLFTRGAHVRAKKVTVQLLKNKYGRRYRGEVFEVAEGHMRNKLHPEGIAAYVLPNQETRIPILPEHEAQKRRFLYAQEASKALKEKETPEAPKELNEDDIRKQHIGSLLDALDFTESTETEVHSNKDLASQQNGKGQSDKKFNWQNDILLDINDKK